jgi:hypothetical protein
MIYCRKKEKYSKLYIKVFYHTLYTLYTFCLIINELQSDLYTFYIHGYFPFFYTRLIINILS